MGAGEGVEEEEFTGFSCQLPGGGRYREVEMIGWMKREDEAGFEVLMVK